jgi:uncharacterized membrane protein YkvA (DUF1232 family)
LRQFLRILAATGQNPHLVIGVTGGDRPHRHQESQAMVSEYSVGFEPADRLAEDRESLRRRFWLKLKRVVAKLPFAEDLLAAYYCAFDKETPRHVQAALLGAIAYFILPFDFIPDMLPVLGFTDDAAVLATAIRLVANHITPEHRDAARAALKRGIDGES